MAPEKRNQVCPYLLLCLLALLWPVVTVRTVWAQDLPSVDALRIQQMRVQVMPEFDDPRVLVMVQGRVSAVEGFPVLVTFRVPAGAQINQMATVNMESAGTTMATYETRPDPADGGWQLVTYELEGAHFFYEYYYGPIVGEEEKAFTYRLSSYHGVEEATVEVQQPKAAEEFATMPAASGRRLDENLRMYVYEIPMGLLEAGEERAISVSYRKADPEPSLTWEQVMALQEGKRAPVVEAEGSGSGLGVPAEVIVFVGGALLILAGVMVGYRLRVGAVAAEEGERERCGMCETALKGGARYCHRCGAIVEPGSGALEGATATSGWPSGERRQAR